MGVYNMKYISLILLVLVMMFASGCISQTQCVKIIPEAKYPTDGGHGVVIVNGVAYKVDTDFYQTIDLNKTVDVRFYITTQGDTFVIEGRNC
jgi:hypothetical protein